MSGVPASLINVIDSSSVVSARAVPKAVHARYAHGVETTGTYRDTEVDQGLRLVRMSSAAIRFTEEQMRAARGDRSSRLPIGVAII